MKVQHIIKCDHYQLFCDLTALPGEMVDVELRRERRGRGRPGAVAMWRPGGDGHKFATTLCVNFKDAKRLAVFGSLII